MWFSYNPTCYQLCFPSLVHIFQNFSRNYNSKIEPVLVPVAIQLQKNPTTLCRSLGVSQRASMAARGGDLTILSRTVPPSQRATLSPSASLRGPNHSSKHQKSKTNQLERRNVWQMLRR